MSKKILKIKKGKGKSKIKIKRKKKVIPKPVAQSESETDYSTTNTECLTNSKNISSDLDSTNPRLEFTDEQGGWVNSDRMNFIDWLNTIYSKIETETFSEQQLKFNEALSRKDLITNRLKPFFVNLTLQIAHIYFISMFLAIFSILSTRLTYPVSVLQSLPGPSLYI